MNPANRPVPNSSVFAGCLIALLMLAALAWTVVEVAETCR